jgi:hypothetical protein
MKPIKREKNVVGTLFALMQMDNGNGLVYVQSSNYNGKVRGGIVKKWLCCNLTQKQGFQEFQKMAREGLPMLEAKALFEKKITSKLRR